MSSEHEHREGRPEDEAPQDRFHRRGFFVEGFRQLLRPIAEIVEDRLERTGMTYDDDLPGDGGPPAGVERMPLPDRPVLRPPGALPADEFFERCSSCAQCVGSCPVNAIRLARSDDPHLDEKPFIDPGFQACVLCDSLACMHACPTGALVPVPLESIRMGTAVVRHDVCLRAQGEDCQICVDKCPVGSRALTLSGEGGVVEVHEGGCTGCGVCEMYCPTEPRAVVVQPAGGSVGGAADGFDLDGPAFPQEGQD